MKQIKKYIPFFAIIGALGFMFSLWAFDEATVTVKRMVRISDEGNEVAVASFEDGNAMSSTEVYSFSVDTLTNTDNVTFTVPDNFRTPYDITVQGWADELSGSATLIFQTQISTAESGTQFWTTVNRDTLTDDGTFVVNAGVPASVTIPRTSLRTRVVVNQTGTASSAVDLSVVAKRFPN